MDIFVIKFGHSVDPIEAHNTLYVARSTTLPVPKVYAIYRRREREATVTYIVVEYVPGTTLLTLWVSLDQDRRAAIARNLRTYFDQLRQLEHPGYIGHIKGGPLLDEMFSETEGAHEFNTSFQTEDELIDRIIRYTPWRPVTGWPTRLDTTNRKNVIVRPDGMPVLIDWEFASWYPTYWEYSSVMFANTGWNNDWHEYVLMALDEYPNQSL
ncbi:hypothetical protein ACJZ2D_000884 [Fusarium nematophilum]